MTLNDIVRLNIISILKARGYYKNRRLNLPQDLKHLYSTLTSIIRGSGGMTLNTLETLAIALDVDVVDLVRWK